MIKKTNNKAKMQQIKNEQTAANITTNKRKHIIYQTKNKDIKIKIKKSFILLLKQVY